MRVCSIGFLFILASLGLVLPTAQAQGVTNSYEGISGDMDKEHRNPVVTVTSQNLGTVVRLLADAYVPKKSLAKYPLQFDFFVNRKLFSSQVRSAELPGAVGVEIGSDVATPPLNFSVVVRVLHPNRQFTTVFNGAVFGSNLVTTFDCTVTKTDEAENSLSFVANGVTTTQASNDEVNVQFQTESVDATKDLQFNGTFRINGEEASGVASLKIDEDVSSSALSGSVTLEGAALAGLSLASADGTTTLSCS